MIEEHDLQVKRLEDKITQLIRLVLLLPQALPLAVIQTKTHLKNQALCSFLDLRFVHIQRKSFEVLIFIFVRLVGIMIRIFDIEHCTCYRFLTLNIAQLLI